MATIKPIDGRSVHQIQSGQVIVDLCSVVKELVENSVDAGATIIDVRFKNQGLDLIEVQDNGSGITPANYASVALKHHTSKLSSYSDIASLQTFGFRGEALASLCALSTLTVTTCLAEDVPKASRLTFESSGRLKGTSVVAAQRGTTVSVETLFHNLPVRRRELDHNIKREWHKVIALLNQYACIQTNVKFSVSQQPTKGKRIILFSTKGNPSTRDNIINIFGAKTMTALVSLDLTLEMTPSSTGPGVQTVVNPASNSTQVRIVGHVSRPIYGDGRQAPDRQMFFVNGRPCSLPQFAKTFNEVYRSYNYSQSPFILADIQLDTSLYDVNVSPDKRSILLHDQHHLLDTLRTSLTRLFDAHEYTVPVSRSLDKATQPPSDDEGPRQATPLRVPDKPAVKSRRMTPESDSDSDEEEATPSFSGKRFTREQTGFVSARSRLTDGQEQSLISNWARPTDDAGSPRLHQLSKATRVNTSLSPNEAGDDATAKFRDQVCNTEKTSSREVEINQPMPVEESNKQSGFTRTVVSELRGVSGSSPTSSQEQAPLRHSRIPFVQPLSLKSPASGLLVQDPKSLRQDASNIDRVSIGGEHAEHLIKYSQKSHNSNLSEPQGKETHLSPGGPLPTLVTGDADSHVSMPEPDLSDSDSLPNDDTASCRTETVSASGTREPRVNRSVVTDRDGEVDVQSLEDESHSQAPSPGMADFLETGEETKASSAAEVRTQTFQIGLRRKDATTQLVHRLRIDESNVRSYMRYCIRHGLVHGHATSDVLRVNDIDAADAEAKLPLIIAKRDFARMRVAGQFNLGFIIAVRPAKNAGKHDELFIIDQHASDEKYNFERLQNTTTIQAQRLVHPKRLQLTALEEEIILENTTPIEANGFKVNTDTTGRWPVGSRCQLTALPLSRETTFNLEDLEELISLLGDSSAESSHIPRPSKVRKMLAMRACRSSVMIGKALTKGQMYTLVKHMGELDKPWNCPHGRPTMRHLTRLQPLNGQGWREDVDGDALSTWQRYAQVD